MTSAFHPTDRTAAGHPAAPVWSPAAARLSIIVVIGAAVLVSLSVTPGEASRLATAQAGADLVRLMRFMAALKGLMAACAAAAVLWRLAVPVSPGWLAAYALACGAMVAGPGLIWSMTLVGTGALLLHGGLLATIVLLWRDPQVVQRLDGLLIARRRRQPGQGRPTA